MQEAKWGTTTTTKKVNTIKMNSNPDFFILGKKKAFATILYYLKWL